MLGSHRNAHAHIHVGRICAVRVDAAEPSASQDYHRRTAQDTFYNVHFESLGATGAHHERYAKRPCGGSAMAGGPGRCGHGLDGAGGSSAGGPGQRSAPGGTQDWWSPPGREARRRPPNGSPASGRRSDVRQRRMDGGSAQHSRRDGASQGSTGAHGRGARGTAWFQARWGDAGGGINLDNLEELLRKQRRADRGGGWPSGKSAWHGCDPGWSGKGSHHASGSGASQHDSGQEHKARLSVMVAGLTCRCLVRCPSPCAAGGSLPCRPWHSRDRTPHEDAGSWWERVQAASGAGSIGARASSYRGGASSSWAGGTASSGTGGTKTMMHTPAVIGWLCALGLQPDECFDRAMLRAAFHKKAKQQCRDKAVAPHVHFSAYRRTLTLLASWATAGIVSGSTRWRVVVPALRLLLKYCSALEILPGTFVWHPDRHNDQPTRHQAEANFKCAAAAYEALVAKVMPCTCPLHRLRCSTSHAQYSSGASWRMP
eukprot:363193-Chlamydomonas_euryale.AAC.18